jgi:hypothetical protein
MPRWLAILLFTAAPAYAHLDVVSPTERSLNADNQKVGPCGGSTAGVPSTRNPANVQTFLPGQKITVELRETINHTGYYRVSFDDDGQDIFQFPTAPGTPGHVIPVGTAGVLVAEVKDEPGKSSYSIEVTLPDLECDNCTMQVAQLMTEKYAGGAPWDETGGNSIYYRCVDVRLTRNPPDLAGNPVLPDLSVPPDLATPAQMMMTYADPSFCSFGGAADSSSLGLLLGTALLALGFRKKSR